ncbi:MAG TPA: hypothetical protein VFI40_00275 [Nocardioides sp.]|nr:hypothetical protein [Nocardioides sp.]
MSTIHHPAQMHLWWYAGVVLAGALLVLMVLTLRPDGSAPLTQQDNGGTTTPLRHYQVFPCHAGRPVPNIELPGCVSPVR